MLYNLPVGHQYLLSIPVALVLLGFSNLLLKRIQPRKPIYIFTVMTVIVPGVLAMLGWRDLAFGCFFSVMLIGLAGFSKRAPELSERIGKVVVRRKQRDFAFFTFLCGLVILYRLLGFSAS